MVKVIFQTFYDDFEIFEFIKTKRNVRVYWMRLFLCHLFFYKQIYFQRNGSKSTWLPYYFSNIILTHPFLWLKPLLFLIFLMFSSTSFVVRMSNEADDEKESRNTDAVWFIINYTSTRRPYNTLEIIIRRFNKSNNWCTKQNGWLWFGRGC